MIAAGHAARKQDRPHGRDGRGERWKGWQGGRGQKRRGQKRPREERRGDEDQAYGDPVLARLRTQLPASLSTTNRPASSIVPRYSTVSRATWPYVSRNVGPSARHVKDRSDVAPNRRPSAKPLRRTTSDSLPPSQAPTYVLARLPSWQPASNTAASGQAAIKARRTTRCTDR